MISLHHFFGLNSVPGDQPSVQRRALYCMPSQSRTFLHCIELLLAASTLVTFSGDLLQLW